MRQYQVYFSGRVQGVGFRFVSQGIADRHPVRGWVRNLPDGRVELCLQGKSVEIEAYLQELRREMSGYIQKEEGGYEDAGEVCDGFGIRY